MKIPNLKAIRDWCTEKFQLKGNYVEKTELDATYQQSTAYTDKKISALINSAPETLDTLKEIADAMTENQDVVEALETAIGLKANASELNSHTSDGTIHITDTERANLEDANSKKHTHENKGVLDGITSELVTAWNNKSEFSGSYNDLTDKPDLSSAGGSISEDELNEALDTKQDKVIINITDELGDWVTGGVTGNTLYSVTYAVNKFVAVGVAPGSLGVAYYSENGIIWTASNIEKSAYALTAITYGNGKFVAVGNHGTTCYSEDGMTWTEGGKAGSSVLYGIAYGNGKFVIFENSGKTYYSEDGIAWTEGGKVEKNIYGMTYGDGKFVAVGEAGTTHHSTDGVSWIKGGEAGSYLLTAVTYGDGKFVTVGNGYMCYSEDGITWTKGAITEQYLYSITYGNGKFVAVGYTGISYYSNDGINWSNAMYAGDKNLNGIIFGNGKFVAVGISGVSYYREFIKETKNLEDTIKYLEENKANKEDLTAENVGALPVNGTAKSAIKASQDGNGKVISETYIPKTAVLNTLEEIDANTSGENIAGARAVKLLNSKVSDLTNNSGDYLGTTGNLTLGVDETITIPNLTDYKFLLFVFNGTYVAEFVPLLELYFTPTDKFSRKTVQDGYYFNLRVILVEGGINIKIEEIAGYSYGAVAIYGLK